MKKSQRRKASIHEDGVDRISNLPDPVLLLILSGLPSTKESIRTSILARRWRYLWTSLPSLDLEYLGKQERSEKSKFKNIVYWALLQRSVDLNSFSLSCLDYFSRSTLERWIRASVMRNVKHLDLTLWRKGKSESEDMVMPHCLVTCASLEVLKLTLGGRLILPSFSGFTALRVLKLESVKLSDGDLVKQFLESCPLLEELTLGYCRVDKHDLLCLSCPNLKKLSFKYWENYDFCDCLKLSCPNLVFLEIQGRVASSYVIEGLYSLKEAVINPGREGISEQFHNLSRLFHITSHVVTLRTDLYFLYECISVARDLAIPNLKTLELTTINAGYMVEGLNQILKIFPRLESLYLTVENVYSYVENSENYDEAEYPKLDGVGTRNLTPDVKWVEFFEFNGEKPKLTIDWYDRYRNRSHTYEWLYVVAKWGNEDTLFH